VNATTALSTLRKLGVPVIGTSDAAAVLGLRTAAASQTLTRLAEAGLLRRLCHGSWWLEESLDPLRLPEYLTAPYPAYVSLQTALHRRGLIEQIPEVTYAVSLARTQRILTTAGTVSVHQLAPEVYGGFEETAHGAKIATAEKALFDVAYLSAGRSRLFTSLPELELPPTFRRRELAHWLAKIPSVRARTITARKLDELLASDRGARVRASAKRITNAHRDTFVKLAT
jgi:predicted transcriptional regulator of viral defense system